MTEYIPDCMSEVIGKWIIAIEHVMPLCISSSSEWRELLLLAAKSDRDSEGDKVEMIMSWMWDNISQESQELNSPNKRLWERLVQFKDLVSCYELQNSIGYKGGKDQAQLEVVDSIRFILSSYTSTIQKVTKAATTVSFLTTWNDNIEGTWDRIDPVLLLMRLVD